MYSVMTEPHARARHATEYQRLKVWFARRLHELGLDEVVNDGVLTVAVVILGILSALDLIHDY